MKTAFLVPALLVATTLSGCIDQKDYETTPVEVRTERGTVVCQLYTRRQVLWDEAISAPPGMSIREADQVCIAEGHRLAGR